MGGSGSFDEVSASFVGVAVETDAARLVRPSSPNPLVEFESSSEATEVTDDMASQRS
jgi:hypothetical protein